MYTEKILKNEMKNFEKNCPWKNVSTQNLSEHRINRGAQEWWLQNEKFNQLKINKKQNIKKIFSLKALSLQKIKYEDCINACTKERY